ncbi:tetratricopeptide repeat protein [candidate division KSB1 bacterium]|nr:tetratricopeptide repeat protein [candidate division KSB1 bacterium]
MKIRYVAVIMLLVGILSIMACQTKEVTSAKVYIQQDNWEKAIEQLENAIKLYPNDVEAHYLLGEGYANQGNWDGMNQMFKKSLELSPQFDQQIKSTREKYWVTTFNSGVNRINGKDLDGAIEKFQTCILIDSQKIGAYRNLAIALTQKQQFDEAKSMYQKALEIEPENVEVIQALAALYFDSKEYNKVVELENKALELDPTNTDPIANLALAYDFLGEKQLARETYEKALAMNPDDADLLFNLARLHYLNGEYEKAIELFGKVISSKPDDFDANVNVGNAFLSMADNLRKVLVEKENNGQEVTPDEKDKLVSFYNQSIPYLEKAIAIKGDSVNIWNNLGIAYIQIGNKEKGEECFKKAEELQNK